MYYLCTQINKQNKMFALNSLIIAIIIRLHPVVGSEKVCAHS